MTVLAWHGEPTLKAAALERLREHRRLDQIVRGSGYWDPGMKSGCQLGCLTHVSCAYERSATHQAMERLFGVPSHVAHVMESFFENAPTDAYAVWWALESCEAIMVGARLRTPASIKSFEVYGLKSECDSQQALEKKWLSLAHAFLAELRNAPIAEPEPIDDDVSRELCGLGLWCPEGQGVVV